MFSEVEQQLVANFDNPEWLTVLLDIVETNVYSIVHQLTHEQLARIEICEQFFPNLPARRTGRVTALSIGKLRRTISNLLNGYPALRSENTEKLVLKLEVANQSIRERLQH
jgi:hypothetical protein